MSRQQRPLIADTTWFVTSVTFQREPLFARSDLAQMVVDQWRHYAAAYNFQLDAYCVMPDHYHVVLTPSSGQTLSQIHAVNSYLATLINQCLGRETKAKVWQGHPWDEAVRDEDMYWQKVAYVLMNPWRAKLIEEPLAQYGFSNIDDWLEREGDDFVLDLFSRYRRWYE